jgi:hypothetical protein
MSKGAPISSSRYPRELSSSGSSDDDDDDAYGDDSFESAASPLKKKQETKGGGGVAKNSSVNLADYVAEPSQGAPGADVIATITRGLDGVSPKNSRGSDVVGDDKNKNAGEHRSTKVTYADVLDEDDNALLKKFNIVLSPRSAMGPQEHVASAAGPENDRSKPGKGINNNRPAMLNNKGDGAMAPGSPISTTRSKRPPSQEMSPSVAATIASVREADAVYKSKKHPKAATTAVAVEDGRGRQSKDCGSQPPQELRRQGSGRGKSAGSDEFNRDDEDAGDNSESDGNSDIEDMVSIIFICYL